MHEEKTTAFMQFLNKAVTPYQSVAAAIELLEAQSFQPLLPDACWELKRGGCYYVNLFDTALVAFRVNEDCTAADEFRLAAAHTDYPGFRVKPVSEIQSAGCVKLNVEPYGSPIYTSWLDRPLSLAGRVSVKGDSPFRPRTMLVDFRRPVLTIPGLAIHFNREMNKGVALNPAKDMQPLLCAVAEGLETDSLMMRLLAQETGVPVTDIINFDLYVYNRDEAALTGVNQEFLSSPRLDNQTSVYACLQGVLQPGRRRKGIDAAVLFDNEEIGNRTKQGAESQTLPRLMEKLTLALGFSREDFLNMLSRSFLLSCDVAHGLHPNHAELYDPENRICMGQGVALKWNFSQKYATDISASAVIEQLMEQNEISYQKFLNRSDVAGGGTLGSAASALMGIRTVDVGAPILSMHSARELMAAADQEALGSLLRAYFCQEA